MGFKGRPFVEGTPTFAPHRKVSEYLEDNARDLGRHIQLGRVVTRIFKRQGKWVVKSRQSKPEVIDGTLYGDQPPTETEFEDVADFVLVASGHYSSPYIPFVRGLLGYIICTAQA
jgi:cation diffusion facilitator CzcD-associated flavoprotein CzcO